MNRIFDGNNPDDNELFLAVMKLMPGQVVYMAENQKPYYWMKRTPPYDRYLAAGIVYHIGNPDDD